MRLESTPSAQIEFAEWSFALAEASTPVRSHAEKNPTPRKRLWRVHCGPDRRRWVGRFLQERSRRCLAEDAAQLMRVFGASIIVTP